MNVLIVDDQRIVLDGMVKGVDWEKYGVESVFTASGVSEGREIIERESIQILFCDIEMPGRNGIELVEWTHQYDSDIQNIFLTSHAEFTYAKKAVELNAFDYVLQPAGYDEIERVLERAIEKWNLLYRQNKVYEYGKLLQSKEKLLAENLVYDLLWHREADFSRIFRELSVLKYNCTQQMLYFPMLFQIQDEHFRRDWKEAECQWAVESMIQKAADGFERELLFYSSSWQNYYVIAADCASDAGEEIGQSLYGILREELACRMACYTLHSVEVKELSEAAESLRKNQRNNVAMEEGVLTEAYCSRAETFSLELSSTVLERWRSALEKGMIRVVKREVYRYLEQMEMNNQANFQMMLEFHQKFSQIFLHMVSVRNIDISNIFSGEYSYVDYNEAYQTIAELKKAVDFAFDILTRFTREKAEAGYAEQARQYVLEHLKDPVKVQDIAEQVGLNPDYLSKMFKKESGMALKDYILMVKIEAAKNMLEVGSQNVSLVASAVGYDNVSNFIQMFKKLVGRTPHEFKKESAK